MPTRTTRLDNALAVTRLVKSEMGREIRTARTSAGASQLAVGRRVGMSHSQFGRIERGELTDLTVDQLSRACSAVGLRLLVRALPDADPALDAGQLALLGRFRRILPQGTRFRTEVPLPLPGDRRCWDGVALLEGGDTAVEAESRLRDIQGLDRRCALKRRDGGIEPVILLVADTAHNRAMLDVHREDLRPGFPLDGRQLLPVLRSGRAPEASGIVLL
jgi:transcriptional regulator with XRE-family HTH domain